MDECIHSLYDLIKDEGAADGETKRPRVRAARRLCKLGRDALQASGAIGQSYQLANMVQIACQACTTIALESSALGGHSGFLQAHPGCVRNAVTQLRAGKLGVSQQSGRALHPR